MSDSSSTFIVSESLFPIKSHGEYYLKVPFRVLVESTSRVHPCQISSGLSANLISSAGGPHFALFTQFSLIVPVLVFVSQKGFSYIGMFRPIRVDHTNCIQVAIQTHSFIVLCRLCGLPAKEIQSVIEVCVCVYVLWVRDSGGW
jgi:hypothetical protein